MFMAAKPATATRRSQEVLVEAGEVEGVERVGGEPAGVVEPDGPGVGDSAAVVGGGAEAGVAEGGAGLGPAGEAVPGAGDDAEGEDNAAFREVGRLLCIADQAGAGVRAEEEAKIDLGADLAVTEDVVPAAGEQGVEPAGDGVAARRGAQVVEGACGIGGDAGVGE